MSRRIMIRYAEIALKKGNRHLFEQLLVNNINKTLGGIKGSVKREHGRMYIVNYEQEELICSLLKKVPGITSFSVAIPVPLDLDEIEKMGFQMIKELNITTKTSFRIETKRSDKNFPLKSPEISQKISHTLLPKFPNLYVNLKNPELILGIEIHQKEALLFLNTIKGTDGLPVKSSGHMTLLLSGGIDSPVAGAKMIRRGIKINAVYFHSPPYTSEGAKEKVIELATILSEYQNHAIDLYIVHFTEIQKTVQKSCKDDYATVFGRRYMLRLANKIAEKTKTQAFITGDSIGQVASQTIQNITAVDQVAELPVLRPLVGSDKNEITAEAKNIGTFEVSIRPFDDCCVLFAPKNPVTKSSLNFISEEEKNLDEETLIENSLKKTVCLSIRRGVIKEYPFFDSKE
ncbi:tRNA 4-thiouridine(8) synthase ThiI [bacterium]|nr:tRNA 4-thiouridine(8) synthase ThiI [bacterium]